MITDINIRRTKIEMKTAGIHDLESYADVLTVEEVSTILQVGRKLVYRMIQEKTIPARRLGRLYRISKKELLNYLEGAD